MVNKLKAVSKKLITMIKLMFFIIFFFSNSFFIYAKDKSIKQPYWILDIYAQYSDEMESHENDYDYLEDFYIKLNNNNIYLNNNQYPVLIGKVNNLSSLLPNDILKSSSRKSELKPFIHPDGSISYFQLKTPIDSHLAKFLLPNQRIIYKDNELILINKAVTLSFLKPADREEFKEFSKTFPVSNLPINSNIIFDYTINADISINTTRRFLHHLRLFNNDNIYTQLNSYITNISGVRLPILDSDINPMIIFGSDENGESIVYLYLFSNEFDFLDKIILKDYYGASRDESTNMYPVGLFYFNIDKNYLIDTWQRFRDETVEIKQYQVSNTGKLQELPVVSNCYQHFEPKDRKIHSAKSLLLTSYQANNYLRLTNKSDDKLDTITLVLNPEDNLLCINYQQAYTATFGKANSKQFFNNDELYQQQVVKLKQLNIDIRQELEYVTFNNINNSPLATYLIDGNKAIYMEDKLFIVGQDYFVAYRQPKDEEITNREYIYNED